MMKNQGCKSHFYMLFICFFWGKQKKFGRKRKLSFEFKVNDHHSTGNGQYIASNPKEFQMESRIFDEANEEDGKETVDKIMEEFKDDKKNRTYLGMMEIQNLRILSKNDVL